MISSKLTSISFSIAYCSFILWVMMLRLPEVLSFALYRITGGFLTSLLLCTMTSLFIFVPSTTMHLVRRLSLLTLIAIVIKKGLDYDLKLSVKFRLETVDANDVIASNAEFKVSTDYKVLTQHVAVVTGANSGLGLSVAKHLIGLGSTVILACRSEANCRKASGEIMLMHPKNEHFVFPMQLDLNDLGNVKRFADEVKKKFKRLDILVNNAGLVSGVGEVTAQGLEKSFGVMHVGHYALTKWLLPLLLKPLPAQQHGVTYAARVINVASDAAFFGNFHPTFFQGTGSGDLLGEITSNCPDMLFGTTSCCPVGACPNTNGYARAKLANVLHAQELQRRVDAFIASSSGNKPSRKYRRLVTASLHPGTVVTNIHEFLASQFSQLISRSADSGALIILHAILSDRFVPGAFIDSMKYSSDLNDYRAKYMQRHLQSFPFARDLPFVLFPETSEVHRSFDYHQRWWNNQRFVVPAPLLVSNATAPDGDRYGAEAVAARLWEVSDQIVKDWSEGRNVLSSEPAFRKISNDLSNI